MEGLYIDHAPNMAAPSGNLDFPSKMQALVKEAKGQQSYVYKQVDVPEPGPGELLVKVSRVGICGSDIHFYKWTSGTNKRIIVI